VAGPVTTAQVAEAAGVSPSTVQRWAKKYGVLPAYVDQHGGRLGRQAVWPPESVEIAGLVRQMLALGLSFEQIRVVQARLSIAEQRAACDAGRNALLLGE
jgi:DNA-binding transcriptional MerR regulator